MQLPPVESPHNGLSRIEGQLSFYERALAEKNRSKLTVLSAVAAILVLVVRALIANTKELQRLNDSHK